MRFLYLVLLICMQIDASSQLNGKYTFRHLDQSDGLLHTRIIGIQQDSKGYIWILNQNGVQRYDGIRFLNFTDFIAHSTLEEIANGSLYFDRKANQIRVVKLRALDKLDIRTNKWSTVTIQDLLKTETGLVSNVFTSEDNNNFQISNLALIYTIGHSRQAIDTLLNPYAGHPYTHTYSFRDTVSGKYFFHNYLHVLIADPETNSIQSSGDDHPTDPLLIQMKEQFGDTNSLRFLMKDSRDNLWLSTWKHWLFRYNGKTKKLHTYSIKDIKKRQEDALSGHLTLLVTSMYEDRQHSVWFGTDHAGLLVYNHATDDFDFITSDVKSSSSILYNYSVNTIFQDRDDNIWVGTDRGISIFNPYRKHFQSVRHIEGNPASIPRNDINAVIETSEGEILIATWGGGISVYDRNWNFIRNILLTGPLAYNLVWSFLEADDGLIWIGCQAGAIHFYDPVKKTIKTINPPELRSTIMCMAKDADGNILFGLHNGKIAVWNKVQNRFYPGEVLRTASGRQMREVLMMYVDKFNQCWVATPTGLKEFDITTRMYRATYVPSNIDSSMTITVNGIAEYNDSTLLVTTIYHGLYLFNKRTHLFSVPSHIYLPRNTSAFAIHEDNSRNFWMTTNFSLYKFSHDLSSQVVYHMDRSILQDALGSNRFIEMSDGRWMTTSTSEVLSFDPVQLHLSPGMDTRVEISGFKIFDKRLNIDSILEIQEAVVLPYDHNFLTIEYAALDYSGHRQTNYYYRLSDIDKTWNYTTTKQFADYTDLKPGTYLFEVKSSESDDPALVTSIPIVITPPWWGTAGFRLLSVLALCSIVYFLLRKRIQTIRHESELKHQIAETEMMALRTQMNPHFIFNCINSIDAMIQSNDKYRATLYLNKFARLIRNVLDSSRQKTVALSKDIETLQLYLDLENIRHPDMFTSSITIDPGILDEDYKVPPLIIQPYVENAILHGLIHRQDNGGKLDISISRMNEHLVYKVEDNGVGRKPSSGEMHKYDKGYGMQISSDRIRLFNDEEVASVQITDLLTDGMPSGTRITVHLNAY